MTDRVIFLDSGVGGLPYCDFFIKQKSMSPYHVDTIYVADRANFPYGKKTKEELCALLTTLIEKIVNVFDPRIIVLACNTASVSAIGKLREKFPALQFVGTVPAVKPAILASKTAHIGVLGTVRTIEDPCIEQIAQKTGAACKITKIAASDLVEFVENKLFEGSDDEKISITKKYIDNFRSLGTDGIVLGCTHFLFLQDEFKKNAAPDITIYDSIEGVCRRVEDLLKSESREQRAESREKRENILLVTGNGELGSKWLRFASKFNLCAYKFDEYIMGSN
jgi:glutamate racemase